MPKLPTKTRPLAALAALPVIALLASGCGATKANEQLGKALFVQKCGGCHTLAQAGTSGNIGPNLDDAFAAARASGETGSTIEGVVKAQVEDPRPMTSNPAVSMPPHVVEGRELDDIAAYVGRSAGIPGATKPKAEGEGGAQVFASAGCGGCHTLAAAHSAGTTGPDFDKVLPGQTPAMVEESIVNPNAKITPGYPANVMPSTFGTQLSKTELKELVEYLIKSTSKGGGKKK